MVDDDFNFQYDTSVSQSFHHLLAAVYRLGYDVRCFGSGYLETDFLRYASGVFSDRPRWEASAFSPVSQNRL